MVKALIVLSMFSLLTVSSCKRECYTCNQYCAYCLSKDSSYYYKICATNGSSGEISVNAEYSALSDSGYNCTQLMNTQNVCDGSKSIGNAVNYYQNEDYYCEPVSQ